MADKMTYSEAIGAMPWQETAKSLVVEGIGGFAGFGFAGYVGRRVQNSIFNKKDPASGGFTTSADKVVAWSGNNLPKLAIWYLLRKVAAGQEGLTQTVLVDASKGAAISLGFDTAVRATHGGTNPGTIKIFNYEILGGSGNQQMTQSPQNQANAQRLIQENSALRTELNKTLQRVAAMRSTQVAPVVQVAPVQVQIPQPAVNMASAQVQTQQPAIAERERRFAFMPTSPEIAERERKFAFMPTHNAPSDVQEREKKYGFAGKSNEKDIASMCGML